MMATAVSQFPKLSQSFRLARVGAWTFAASALSGLAHLVWADRTAIAAVAAGAAEVAWRRVFPTGRLSGFLANVLCAYRQITAAASVPAAPAAEHPVP